MEVNPFSLSGKTILVTGASSGIGRAIAVACANMGAKLIITARNKERLEETISLMSGEGHRYISADLTKVDDIYSLVTELPKLDGVVSNAGVVKSIVALFSDYSETQEIFNTNVFSHINLIQQLLENKRLNKEASIVFTSSISGVYCGLLGGSLYGATKSAINGYVRALALELAPRKIRVNTINPGMIETDLVASTSITKEELEEDKKKYPMKRYGRPDEVANSVVYLLSDVTKWMTGTSLLLDGGYSVQ
ncbi:MAG: SDR family oxidoreductase [Flavobacteriales bacterium]|nr:SDR family oxidoreductase [Flavobacteriales bacterium]